MDLVALPYMEGGVKQLLMNHEVQTNETVLPNTVKPHPELFLLVLRSFTSCAPDSVLVVSFDESFILMHGRHQNMGFASTVNEYQHAIQILCTFLHVCH